MKRNDIQTGSPFVDYKDTKANIEAIASPVLGMRATQTDAPYEQAYYNGSAWIWSIDSSSLAITTILLFDDEVLSYDDEIMVY